MTEMVPMLKCLLYLTTFYHLQVIAVPLQSNMTEGGSCSKSDPELDECVRQGLTAALKYYRKGNEVMGLPPLEPLIVPFMEIRHDQNNLTLELTIRDVRISGFTDTQLAKVKVNLEDGNKIEVSAKTPLLTISGQYISEGLIVSFPLHSAGTFTINMSDVTSSWIVYLQEQTRDQSEYLQVDGFNVDMIPVNTYFKPAAELDGDNHLGEAVSTILNENSSEVYSMMKSRLTMVFSELLSQLANTVLSRVPKSVFLRP